MPTRPLRFLGLAAALVGSALLAACGTRPAPEAPTATLLANLPTDALLPTHSPVPTVEPSPTVTLAPTATRTRTPLPSPTQTQTPELILDITQAANVRSGPGTNYPVIGYLKVGQRVPVVGRDASARWYVIGYPAAANGQGWVGKAVGTFDGDVNGLPVVVAPPTPRPSRTPTPTITPPPAATNTPASSHGITGQLTLCDPNKPSFATVIERICFRELIVNHSGGPVAYHTLGVQATNLSGGPSQFHTSWMGDLVIGTGCTGPSGMCGGAWEDGIFINAPGTYRLTLDICYSQSCGSGGDWETLTPGIIITVVNWTPSP